MRLRTKLMAGLAAAAMVLGGAAVAQKTQFISVLTGGQSGVYYPLGVALAQILGE